MPENGPVSNNDTFVKLYMLCLMYMDFGFRRRMRGDCGGPGFGRTTDNTKNRRDKQQKNITFIKT
jgi:hypothetical protein